MNVSEQDLANISGMHAGDLHVSVHVGPDGRPVVLLEGKNDQYMVLRKLSRDAEGKLVLEAMEFKMKPEFQGQGRGADVFGRIVNQAEKMGVDRIVARAAREDGKQNGYYTWARFGYDAPIPSWMNHILPSQYHNAGTISNLMRMPGGAQAWKEKGIGMDLSFNPRRGSESRQTWDAYQKARKK
jgi:hypothetical protein